MKKVLTIAGSDSSGGAGIQADIKTFSAHRHIGGSVITSITSQNSNGVRSRQDLPVEVIEDQLGAVFEDERPVSIKTGMLGNREIVESVAKILKRNKAKNLIIDPVIRSSSGKILLSKDGVNAMKEKLFPLALLVTPNISEAEELSGIKIKKTSDRIRVAKAILKTGVKNVLIKGGHLKGPPEDFLYDGKKTETFSSERIPVKGLHGTGCVLSAAIVCALAEGKSLPNAISQAKRFIQESILGGQHTGNVEPLASLFKAEERLDLLNRVSLAIENLKEMRIGHLIPEVQSNIGVGISGASGPDDVIAFPGRIVRLGEDIVTVSHPRFGGSQHVAKIVLTIMRYDSSRRAVMNIKMTTSILNACRQLKFKMASFRRADEPPEVKQMEGSSLEWGTDHAIQKNGSVPDIIYDLGGQGKEEMIRVLADDVESLVEKIGKIHRTTMKNKKMAKGKELDKWRVS
ncbi:MAG: bifunctional hydroxymethylpyrimidine kinase/phosphomethylpyrimidine kinase [Nitrospinales bacterium]